MGTRKHNAPMLIEGPLTVAKDMTMSSAASVGKQLSCSTGMTVASTGVFIGTVKTSTSMNYGGAEIVDVVLQPSTLAVALTGAGGMAVVGSTSTVTYYLPISTAGTLFYLFYSSGDSTIVTSSNTTNTKIAGPGSKTGTTITGSTADHCVVIAQSSSQWNIFSHSSNIAHA